MNRPLRVAIDLRPLALPTVTGIGVLVTQVLEELSARGISFVGVSNRPLPPGRAPAAIAVAVDAAPRGRIRWEGRALPRLLRAIDPPPDLYHATWNHGVPKGLPFPSLLSLHDLIPWVAPRHVPWPRPAILHRALYRDAVRRSAREAAVIVTLSEASRRDIAARLPADAAKATVIPCALPRWFGPPSPGSAEAARARFGGAPYWLYLGGFDPRKGLDVLLDALAAAAARGARLPDLVLAGAPTPEGEACRARAAALGLRAHFPGYVADSDLAALYAGASLFLYPSRYEGFGIPPLLAMAAGVPSLVGDGGALPEVVGDGGVVVPSGDVVAWSRAVERAAADPDSLRPLGAAGSARAARFTVEALAERMTRAYERAASRRAGSA
ncbi:MAG TPA: glycosyltransferase family 1 protein [Candidatus Eisenbacteria bacterium]